MYNSTDFNKKSVGTLKKGTTARIQNFEKSRTGYPRFKLTNGKYITAYRNTVRSNVDQNIYYVEETKPNQIILTSDVDAFQNRSGNFVKKYKKGTVLQVKSVEYSHSGWARLRTNENLYFSANKALAKEYVNSEIKEQPAKIKNYTNLNAQSKQFSGYTTPGMSVTANVFRNGKKVRISNLVTSDKSGYFNLNISIAPKGRENIVVYVTNEYNRKYSRTDFLTEHNYLALGDSIVKGNSQAKSYVDLFADQAVWSVDNEGVPSATISNRKKGDLANIVNQSIDFSAYSVVSLAFGTNDYGQHSKVSLDQLQKELVQSINTIRRKNKNAKIIAVLPIPRYISEESNELADNVYNSNGYTFNHLLVMLRDVYREYNIPFLDWSTENISFSKTDFYDLRLHPNQNKQNDMYRIYQRFIQQNIK